jgi:RNA polymerase sigma factor (sigma-70 family)
MVADLEGVDGVAAIATFPGLYRAAQLWDPARGVKFSTYSDCWMLHACRRAWENSGLIRIPPKPVGGDRAELVDRLRAVALPEFSDGTPMELAAPEVDAAELLDLEEQRSALASALRCLPRCEQMVLKLHYLRGMTLTAIGERYNRTREWARQQKESGLARLRQHYAAELATEGAVG